MTQSSEKVIRNSLSVWRETVSVLTGPSHGDIVIFLLVGLSGHKYTSRMSECPLTNYHHIVIHQPRINHFFRQILVCIHLIFLLPEKHSSRAQPTDYWLWEKFSSLKYASVGNKVILVEAESQGVGGKCRVYTTLLKLTAPMISTQQDLSAMPISGEWRERKSGWLFEL